MPRKKIGYKSVKGKHVKRTGPKWDRFHEETARLKKEAAEEKEREREERRQRRIARGRPWHYAPKRGKWIDYSDDPEPDRDPIRVNPNQLSFTDRIDLVKEPYFVRQENFLKRNENRIKND